MLEGTNSVASLVIRGNDNVRELSVLTLNCSVQTTSRPVVTWLRRREGEVTVILNTTRISVTNQYWESSTISILTINRAAPSDTGEYVCEARGDIDTAVVDKLVTVPGSAHGIT